MRTLVSIILVALGWVSLNLIFAGIEFMGNNYSDTLGPIVVLGGTAALAVFAFKKGK